MTKEVIVLMSKLSRVTLPIVCAFLLLVAQGSPTQAQTGSISCANIGSGFRCTMTVSGTTAEFSHVIWTGIWGQVIRSDNDFGVYPGPDECGDVFDITGQALRHVEGNNYQHIATASISYRYTCPWRTPDEGSQSTPTVSQSTPTQEDDEDSQSTPTATQSASTEEEDEGAQSTPAEEEDEGAQSIPTEEEDEGAQSTPAEEEDEGAQSIPTEEEDEGAQSTPAEEEDEAPTPPPVIVELDGIAATPAVDSRGCRRAGGCYPNDLAEEIR